MKAIYFERFGDRGVLKFGEMPEPKPVGRQLLLAVERSSVNFVDIRERQGTYNRPETHVGGIQLPHVSGLQAVGKVVAAASAEDQAWVGKKVVAYTPQGGSYAERVVAETNLCVPIPEEADADPLAALPNQGLTAYLLLTASTKLQAGNRYWCRVLREAWGALRFRLPKF